MLEKFGYLGHDITTSEGRDGAYLLSTRGVRGDPSAGVEGGAIQVTMQDMKSIFDPCINNTISCIQEQICAVQGQGLRVSVWYTHVFWSFAILISTSRLLL